MRRQMRHTALGGILVVFLGLLAAPTVADPPPSSGAVQRFIIPDGFGVMPDFENGFWGFANITRQGFCEWLAGGEVGPPPAIEPAFVQVVDTGSAIGNCMASGADSGRGSVLVNEPAQHVAPANACGPQVAGCWRRVTDRRPKVKPR